MAQMTAVQMSRPGAPFEVVKRSIKMGYRTVAIGRGKDKEPLALKLGAARYLDAGSVNGAEELALLGGEG